MERLGAVGTMYLYAALLLMLLCLFLGPNSNSLHTLYRDRLSRAFLFERRHLDAQGAADTRKFSSLKPFDDKSWSPSAALSPYLIVNTAINLQGSETLNRRGRNADTFIFSPLHIGSRPTGYVTTKDMEAVVPELGLASAMAISGAAASANMGRHTIKMLTFSLSLLNIRLGYWLPNPKRLAAFRHLFQRLTANIGTWFFAIETIGHLGEKTRNVYLTDGGHIENLGIYELLRRRCKVIVAVDAEVDPHMTFSALATLQVMARIDLGITIDLSWDSIRQNARGATSSLLNEPGGRGSRGPHGGIGIIRYNDKEQGVLIYIKSSLTGDEGDAVLDYKRRYPTFPHETTVDQFFSEEQFEAYRALGFHAARGLLTGADDFAKPYLVPKKWRAEVTAALELINVPPAKAAAIVAHI